MRRDRHSPIFQALKPPRQGIGFCKAAISGFDKTNAVRQHRKRTFSGFLRVFLTQRTRSGISSVHKGRLAHTDALSIKRFKILRRKVDLASDFNAGGNHALQTMRNTRNCPDVGGDVFANPSITSRCCSREYAIFIEQIDCKTVNLDLGEHIQIAATRVISHSGFPACELFQRKNIIQAGHLLEVFNRSKGFRSRATNLSGWRICTAILRVLCLKVFEFAVELVVLCIRQNRSITVVVRRSCIINFLNELVVAVN